MSSKSPISLEADWEFVSNFSVEASNDFWFSDISFAIRSENAAPNENVFYFRIGRLSFQNKIAFFEHGSTETTYAATALDAEDLNQEQTLTLKYSAADHKMTITFGGKSCSYVTTHTDVKKAAFQFGGEVAWPKSTALDRDYKVGGTFQSVKYTHYTPNFEGTQLCSPEGCL